MSRHLGSVARQVRTDVLGHNPQNIRSIIRTCRRCANHCGHNQHKGTQQKQMSSHCSTSFPNSAQPQPPHLDYRMPMEIPLQAAALCSLSCAEFLHWRNDIDRQRFRGKHGSPQRGEEWPGSRRTLYAAGVMYHSPGLDALSLPTILITELCRLVSWRQVLTAVFEILSKWSAIQVLHLLCGQESRPFLRVLGRTHRPSCR